MSSTLQLARHENAVAGSAGTISSITCSMDDGIVEGLRDNRSRLFDDFASVLLEKFQRTMSADCCGCHVIVAWRLCVDKSLRKRHEYSNVQ
jgi:hypothetical protein